MGPAVQKPTSAGGWMKLINGPIVPFCRTWTTTSVYIADVQQFMLLFAADSLRLWLLKKNVYFWDTQRRGEFFPRPVMNR